MSIKNTKKLAAINQKIDTLQKIKNQLEANIVQYISQQIAKILTKKNYFNIDKNTLLRKIKIVIDEV